MGDGYTKVPNDIYDALLRQPLTDIERRTAFLIVRLTNGWQKPSDEASYGFMADYMAVSRRSVIRAVKNLREMGIIHAERTGGGMNELQIQNPKKWDKLVTSMSPVASDTYVTKTSDTYVTHRKKEKESACQLGADSAPPKEKLSEYDAYYEDLMEQVRKMKANGDL